jgi:hypothetical protein
MKVIPSPRAIVNLLQSSQEYVDLELNTLFVSVVTTLCAIYGENGGFSYHKIKLIFSVFKFLRPSTGFTQPPNQRVLGSFYA